MKESARYPKNVEWLNEDESFVGSASSFIMGGCHGTDVKAVFDELFDIVDEAILSVA